MSSAPGRGGAPAGDDLEGLLWLIFRHSSNPIVMLDEQQRVLEANEPTLKLLGKSRGELLGVPIASSFSASEGARAAEEWQRLLRAGGGAGKRVIARPDGTSIEVDWAAHRGRIGGRAVVVAVMLHPHTLPGTHASAGPTATLTRREKEVVTLIALGLDTREIASSLHVSPETVKSHVRNAMSKLGAHTRAHLTAIALATGQIAPTPDANVPRRRE